MGRVEIRVIEARNIGDVQKVGIPDPYVKVKVGHEKKTQLKYKTRVIDDCLNPVWNELFKFQIADTDSMQVRFEVWNDNLMKDDVLGSYAINLNALTRGVVLDTWAILTGTTLATAELHLRILAVDFGLPPLPGAQVVTSIEQDVISMPSNQASRPGKAEDGYQQQPTNPSMPAHPLVQGGNVMGGFQATPPPPQWGAQPTYGGAPQGYGSAPQGYGGAPQSYGGAPQGYGSAPQGYGGAPQGYGGPQAYAAPQGYPGPQAYGGAPQGYAPPQPYGGYSGYGGGAPQSAPLQFAQGIPPGL